MGIRIKYCLFGGAISIIAVVVFFAPIITIAQGGTSPTTVNVTPGRIYAYNSDGQRIELDATAGIVVEPAAPIEIQAFVRAYDDETIDVVPRIVTKRLVGMRDDTRIETGNTVALSGTSEQEFLYPLTASSTPGAYTVLLQFVEGQGIAMSNEVEFRYVVRGISSAILSLGVDQFALRAGETSTVRYELTGSADGVSAGTGTVTVDVMMEGEIAGTFTSPVNFLDPATLTGVANVLLSQDLGQNPGVRITIRSDDGTVLDEAIATVVIPASLLGARSPFAQAQNIRALATLSVAIIIIFGLVWIVVFLFGKRPHIESKYELKYTKVGDGDHKVRNVS